MQRLKRVIACIEDPPPIAKIFGHDILRFSYGRR
jgi:hypothetical protein